MTLYDNPLGKLFSGSDKSLVYFISKVCKTNSGQYSGNNYEATYISSSKQEKEFLNFFKEEMIGAVCVLDVEVATVAHVQLDQSKCCLK